MIKRRSVSCQRTGSSNSKIVEEKGPAKIPEEDLKKLQKSFVTSFSRGSRVLESMPTDAPSSSVHLPASSITQTLKTLFENAEIKETRGWVDALVKDVEKYGITDPYDFMLDGLWIDTRKKAQKKGKAVSIDGPQSWNKYIASFNVPTASVLPEMTPDNTQTGQQKSENCLPKEGDDLQEELVEQLQRLEANENLEKKAKKQKIRRIHERLRNINSILN